MSQDGASIEWNGNGSEKSYEMAAWMKFLIDNHVTPNHVVNGVIDAQGEEPNDRWQIHVRDNIVTTMEFSIEPTGNHLPV